ncbi:hypothetical protein [Streptomyces malaysiensis]|uniref:Uncharacterized protein n=1 Tax=Streptomyces malaysiensis subsp. samsunensis TaxID=459658 RepID=A0A9X2RZN2_STRMQ|nr:hypothetical protein [Streptomyces samsunensis]MCQ8836398.1 hypothetical protein [Streptomyces samsunensis]
MATSAFDLSDECVETVGPTGHDGHTCTESGQRERGALADSATGPGDQGDCAGAAELLVARRQSRDHPQR